MGYMKMLSLVILASAKGVPPTGEKLAGLYLPLGVNRAIRASSCKAAAERENGDLEGDGDL